MLSTYKRVQGTLMIGGIIQVADNDIVSPLIYHKFGNKSVLDLTTESMLLSAHLHKVIISAPLSERKNISGVAIGHNSRVNMSKREALGRAPLTNYYQNEEGALTGLYLAALQNNLDHIVRVQANSPLIPSWFINKAINEYFNKECKINITTKKSFDDGLRVDVFPFWRLAEAYIYQENRMEFDIYAWQVEELLNQGELHIPHAPFDLEFKTLEQVEAFDSIINNLEKGHDLAEIIGDEYGNNEENIKE